MTFKNSAFATRHARNMQETAKTLAEKRQTLVENVQTAAVKAVESRRESTFREKPMTLTQRRLQEQRDRGVGVAQLIQEFVAEVVTESLPIDQVDREVLKPRIGQTVTTALSANAAFQEMMGSVRMGSPVGTTMNIGGSTDAMNTLAGLMASRYDAGISHRNENTEFGRAAVVNTMDVETTIGSDPFKDGSAAAVQAVNSSIAEAIEKTAAVVRERVVHAFKENVERTKKLDELKEAFDETKDANFNVMRSKKNFMTRGLTETTVFAETLKSVYLFNESFADTADGDKFLAEALLQYTLIEAGRLFGFEKRTDEQIIVDMQRERAVYARKGSK